MAKPKILVDLYNRVTEFTDGDITPLRKYFTYSAPGAFFNWRFKEGLWDGKICCIKNGAVGTGLFMSKLPVLEKLTDCKLVITDHRKTPKFTKRPFVGVPTDYQQECVDAMIAASSYGGIVLAGTGSGKTFIAAYYFSRLKGSALFIADELTLLKQSQDELSRQMGEPVGIIGGGKLDQQRITVATPHTLQQLIRKPKYQEFLQQQDVIVLDEFHVSMNARSRSIIHAVNPYAVFGLTATLELKKKNIAYEAYQIAGPVVFDFGYRQGVDKKVLSPGVVIGLDLVRNQPTAKQMSHSEIYRLDIMESKRRNQLICDLVREGIKRDKHVAVLVSKPGHVRILSALLQDIKHRTVHGARKGAVRIKAKERFSEGKIQLLIANDVFKKGISIDVLDIVIDGAARPNANDARQKYGRGVRLCEEKRGLLYFDIGDQKPKGGFNNRFSAGTKRRRRALKEQGVPVLIKRARGLTPAQIYDLAESELTKFLIKL